MEEREIIKSVRAYDKVNKAIIIALVIIATICSITLAILKQMYKNYTIDYNKLSELGTEKYSNYTDLETKKSKYEDDYIEKYITDQGLTTKKSGYYSSYTNYYINNERVDYSVYNAKKKELENEANTLLKQDEEYNEISSELKQAEQEYQQTKADYELKEEEKEKFDEFYFNIYGSLKLGICLYLLAFLAFIFYLYISKMEITVSNKRVYGKKAFGKRVDLPFDSISAVGTSFLKGIDVGTSSGKIKFKGIKNNNEIHTEISNLLNSRQQEIKAQEKKERMLDTMKNPAEEIKKYKDLLDSGVITQEEFEEKKKQLLNL